MIRTLRAMTTAVVVVPLLLTTVGTASAVPGPVPEGAAADTSSALPRYDVAAVITDDGGLGPVGRGMSETGTIVGYTDWPLTAFSWDRADGMATLPGLTGDTHRVASDVNDAGVVVGHSGYETIEPPQRAVRWIDGVPDELGTPGLTDSHAEAINEAGTIVGWGYSGSDTHAFVWTEDGGAVDITPTAQLAYAYDVNESGQVTGYSGSQAFVWESGVLTNLGVPDGYAFSFGFAINDAGVVAAHVTTASGNSERVARWSPGAGWQVLGGVGEDNISFGINNSGTIVGEGRPTAGLERAFVFMEGVGLFSLTEQLTTSEWFLLAAYDVDDAGRIVALASSRSSGETATLFLKPVSVPMQDEDLRVRLRGASDSTTGVAKLRVLDQGGEPVRRALVDGSWSLNGDVVDRRDTDETDNAGRAVLRKRFGALSSGDVVEFCIKTITRRGYEYEPPVGGPSCASATAR